MNEVLGFVSLRRGGFCQSLPTPPPPKQWAQQDRVPVTRGYVRAPYPLLYGPRPRSWHPPLPTPLLMAPPPPHAPAHGTPPPIHRWQTAGKCCTPLMCGTPPPLQTPSPPPSPPSNTSLGTPPPPLQSPSPPPPPPPTPGRPSLGPKSIGNTRRQRRRRKFFFRIS